MAFRLMQQIVDHLEHRFPPDTLIYSMTTNGALLDRYAEFLVEKKFELLISLDGNRENSAYRVFKNGKPTFDTAMAAACPRHPAPAARRGPRAAAGAVVLM